MYSDEFERNFEFWGFWCFREIFSFLFIVSVYSFVVDDLIYYFIINDGFEILFFDDVNDFYDDIYFFWRDFVGFDWFVFVDDYFRYVSIYVFFYYCFYIRFFLIFFKCEEKNFCKYSIEN